MELIEQFQIGYMMVVFAVLLIVPYLLIRQLRRFGAWMNRDEAPKERVGAYVSVLAIIGVLAGGMSQSIVDLGVACHDAGHPVITCVVENS